MTTIQVSKKLLNELKNRKISEGETYEDLIWGLLEDTMELSENTKRRIRKSAQEVVQGKTRSLGEVEEELGL